MMPASYYRELRATRRELEICMKCGKADAEFPYTCCTGCRKRQAQRDRERAALRLERAKDRREEGRQYGSGGVAA